MVMGFEDGPGDMSKEKSAHSRLIDLGFKKKF